MKICDEGHNPISWDGKMPCPLCALHDEIMDMKRELDDKEEQIQELKEENDNLAEELDEATKVEGGNE